MLSNNNVTKLFFAFLLTLSAQATVLPSKWPTIETTAKQALLIDYQTGTILLTQNPDQVMVPSSMTKIMTTYCVFEKIKQGHISLETPFPVSEKAWKTGGTRMYLKLNSMVKVEDLLKGIIIQSGNDACVTIAEGLMGNEALFVATMNEKAREMGANNTVFKNSHGLHEDGHYTTAQDLLIISKRLIMDFPEYYYIHGEKEFIYNNIRQFNRNPLLRVKDIQCDGIKTGHTDAGGYGIVVSALNTDQSGQRLLMVVNGFSSEKERAQETRKLISWAQQTFTQRTLYKPGDLITQVPTVLAQEDLLPVSVETPITITVPRAMLSQVKVEIVYQSPIKAPIFKGDTVAYLLVTIPGYEEPLKFPLLAAISIESASFFKKIKNSLNSLILGAR